MTRTPGPDDAPVVPADADPLVDDPLLDPDAADGDDADRPCPADRDDVDPAPAARDADDDEDDDVDEPLPPRAPEERPLRVAALALIRDRRVLMVRVEGQDVLYLPGGKIEPGEGARQALVREAAEEVALDIDPASIEDLFTVLEEAHGAHAGRMVSMTVYRGEPRAGTAPEPTPSGEVAELELVGSADADRCPPAGRAALERLVALQLID